MDKWKGTLTAGQAHQAFIDGWREAEARTSSEASTFIECPMSDGGEGFGPSIGLALGGVARTHSTVDAAGNPVQAEWWWIEDSRTAVFETAQSNGLAMLPAGKYHPFDCDTLGVGEVVKHIVAAGAEKMFLGIGGRATNDGGFGMARAIGYRFVDTSFQDIHKWTDLDRLAHIIAPTEKPFAEVDMIVACDVGNPLLGDEGATRIYGPQKGLTDERDKVRAEELLGRLADAAALDLGVDLRSMPGAGAAGGLGFGLATFAGARFASGFSIFSELTGLEAKIRSSDLVVSGEGKADSSTLMGKGVGCVVDLARKHNIPVIVMCGDADPEVESSDRLLGCWVTSREFGQKESMESPAECIRRLTQERCLSWFPPRN